MYISLMKNSLTIILISLLNSALYAQSDMYKQVSGAPYMKYANVMKCDSTDEAIGTTIHELVCLGKEFLELDSLLTSMLKDRDDSLFIYAQHNWEIYRAEQALLAQREVQNNLGKIDYLNALLIITRNRINTIEAMRERY